MGTLPVRSAKLSLVTDYFLSGRRSGTGSGSCAVRRALFLIDFLDDFSVLAGANCGRQLSHGIQIAQRLPAGKFAGKMRHTIAGVPCQKDKASGFPQSLIVSE